MRPFSTTAIEAPWPEIGRSFAGPYGPSPVKVAVHVHSAAIADGMYPFVQVFATRLAEISTFAKKLPKHAAPNASVWISYPKKTSKVEGDLSRDLIRRAMIGRGWRAVSIVAIDQVWSALRFRPIGQVGSRLKRGLD